MRQRLAIARAMLHRPRILLLDEPFTGLDPAAAMELRDSLRRQVVDEGIAIVLTTHDLHHVEKICDRLTVINDGKVVASGSLAELAAAPREGTQEVLVVGEGLTEALVASMREAGLLLSARFERGATEAAGATGATARATIACTPAQFRMLGRELVLRGVVLETYVAKTRSLEELFVDLVAPRRGAS
jgi:ABC-2 type transport system ATP-binding protein